MYVRDELGAFLSVRARFCCRYRYSHPSGGGDQRALVTASLRYIPALTLIELKEGCTMVLSLR